MFKCKLGKIKIILIYVDLFCEWLLYDLYYYVVFDFNVFVDNEGMKYVYGYCLINNSLYYIYNFLGKNFFMCVFFNI